MKEITMDERRELAAKLNARHEEIMAKAAEEAKNYPLGWDNPMGLYEGQSALMEIETEDGGFEYAVNGPFGWVKLGTAEEAGTRSLIRRALIDAFMIGTFDTDICLKAKRDSELSDRALRCGEAIAMRYIAEPVVHEAEDYDI